VRTLLQAQNLAKSIWQELLPTQDRLAGSLRTASAVCIASFILLAGQTPAIPPGIFFIYILSYDSVYLTISNCFYQLIAQATGIAAVVLLVAVSRNDPFVRFVGLPVIIFICAYFCRASTRPQYFTLAGILATITVGNWELHRPAETLLHLSMWPLSTGAVAIGCKVAIQYIFTRRDPYHSLQKEMDARLQAAENLFRAFAENRPDEDIRTAASVVESYAISGQGTMHSLLEEVQNHPRRDYPFRVAPASVASIARMLDLSASYAHAVNNRPGSQDVVQCSRIASALKSLHDGNPENARATLLRSTDANRLSVIESVLSNIATTSTSDFTIALPASRPQPWLRSDAWTNPDYATYAAKVSTCTAICYLAYNALDWRGISTAALTVVITALSTSGASNQKILFRVIGSVIGGVVLGLGCTVFVWPYADTALPFFLSLFLVAFLAAWVAKSPHIGYVGLQIAFSFFLIAFEGFSAPTQLEPARDRIVGVLLALVVMWLIFHQFHPERAIDKMRHGLARLLGVEAGLFERARTKNSAEIVAFRPQAVELIESIRSLAEVVSYEIDGRQEHDLQVRETIQDAASSSTSLLLLGITSLLHSPQAPDENDRVYSELEAVGAKLRQLSRMLERASVAGEDANLLDRGDPISSQHELWRICERLESECIAIAEPGRQDTSRAVPSFAG